MLTVAAVSTLHARLYGYWNTVRGARRMPSRADLNPAEIAPLLAFVALIERREDGYYWRLIGTGIVEHFGRDLTGERYGARFGPPGFVAETIATFDAALAQGIPFFDEFVYRSGRGLAHAVSRLVCPLAPAETHFPMVIHSRIHAHSREMRLPPFLADQAWGELRNRQPVATAIELQQLSDEWLAKASEAAPGQHVSFCALR